ncbi:IclR family transcriptional regulator [Cetobacterium sp.]|uniref:IclR family transcriptional regulator n=1 Tax=Cetobacterium sp. TaxID=2071632 RepID=UPI003F2A45FD
MEKKFIQSLGRGMDILEYLSINPKAKLQDISNFLNLNKSTLHSLISTLEQLGYVEKGDKSPNYSLGVKVFQLGKVYEKDFLIKKMINPILKELSEFSSETTYLTLQIGKSYIYVDKYESLNNLKISPELGTEENIYSNSAIGKIYESFFCENCLQYSLDLEEVEVGMNCIAFPFLKNNRLLGVIGIGGPSSRLTLEKMMQCKDKYYEILSRVK